MKTKIIYTSPILDYPPAGGPTLRVYNSLLALSEVAQVCLIPQTSRRNLGVKACKQFRNVCSKLIFPTSTFFQLYSRFAWVIPKIFKTLFPKQSDMAHFLVRVAAREKINIVWFGYGNISHALMKKVHLLSPNLKIVCDTDSVWSRFILRELPLISDPKKYFQVKLAGREKEKEEREWVKFCSIITAVSAVDADYYRHECGGKEGQVKLFSNAIDLKSYADCSIAIGLNSSPSLFLGGSFWPGSPMEHAFRWFYDGAFPIIKKGFPSIRLLVVGKGAKETIFDIKDPSVQILGKVPSVVPFLKKSSVAIVPLHFESGTRFKILEAAACGVPVVSTTLGAEGIPVTSGRHLLIGDSHEDFAKEIMRILQNGTLGKQLAKSCFDLVSEKFCLKSLSEEGKEIILALNSTYQKDRK